MPTLVRHRRLLALVGPLLAACATPSSQSPVPPARSCPTAPVEGAVESEEILCREPVANKVQVKHILIGWKDLATAAHPGDPRAAQRTAEQARQLAHALLDQVRSGAAIEPLMKENSEDPASAQSGAAYDVSPDASLVSPFKSLSLRLNVGEAGIVRSGFGLHVIQRVQ